MATEADPGSPGAAAVATGLAVLVAALDLLATLLAGGWSAPPLALLVRHAALAALAALALAALAELALIAPAAKVLGLPRVPARLAFAFALALGAATPALASFLGGEPRPLWLSRALPLALAGAALGWGCGVAATRSARGARAASGLVLALPLLALLGFAALWLARFQLRGAAAQLAVLALLGAAAAALLVLALRAGPRAQPSAWHALVLAALAAWGFGPLLGGEELPQTRRHEVRRVILLVVDTLRADALSHASAGAPPTPHLDALARESVVFAAARAPSPWTLPSMVTLLSGVAPEAHQVLSESLRVPRQLPMLAERMARAGYRTAGFSRNAVLLPHTGIQAGLERYACLEPHPPETPLGGALWRALAGDPRDALASDRALTATALGWLARQRGEDAFLWLQYYDPHAPYEPPADLLPEGEVPPRIGRRFAATEQVRAGYLVPDRDERAWIRALYDAEVRETDRRVGELVQGLRDLGMLDDTLLVVTSDHGEEFWEHGGFEHGHALHDELLRVPLLVRLPGGRAAARVDAPVELAAVPATVLELCGLPWSPAEMAGPLLLRDGRAAPAPDTIAATGLLYYEQQSAVVFEGLKYVVRHLDGREQLFDLAADPGELHPLGPAAAADALERGRLLLERLRDVAADLRQRLGLPAPERSQLGPGALRALQELGYAE